MRSILALVIAVIAFPLVGAPEGNGTPVESRIDAVTVYLDRALVSRTASAQMEAGVRTLVFANLPSEIEDDSVRLRIEGPARLESLQVHRTFLAQHQEETARKLEAQRKALEEEVQEQRDLLTALERGTSFLGSIQAVRAEKISRELGRDEGKGPDVADYKAVLGFLTDGQVEIAARVRGANAALAELAPKLAAKQREWEEARSSASLERKEVVAVVSAQGAGAVNLTLAYFVPGAMWFPAYDARSDAQRSRVDLACYGVIQQATGEDWKDARITLSAARPAVQTRLPELAPWYLALGGVVQNNDRSEQQSYAGNSWSPSTNMSNLYESRNKRWHKGQQDAYQLLLENRQWAEAVAVSVEKRTTSAVFAVAGRESVATDGKPHRAILQQGTLDVQKAYRAIPKISLNTYVTGKMANALSLPLLPGKVNVFVGQDLIGSSTIDFVAPRETAELYLGVDESIKVTRELDSRSSSKTFFSKRKRLEIAYEITAENLADKPVKVSLHEALPVSSDERVRVRGEDLDPKPAEADRGLVRWELDLAPGQKRQVRFSYSVEYPNELDLPEVAHFERDLKVKK